MTRPLNSYTRQPVCMSASTGAIILHCHRLSMRRSYQHAGLGLPLWLNCLHHDMRQDWSDITGRPGFDPGRDADIISGAYATRLISQTGTDGLPLSSLVCERKLPHFTETYEVILVVRHVTETYEVILVVRHFTETYEVILAIRHFTETD